MKTTFGLVRLSRGFAKFLTMGIAFLTIACSKDDVPTTTPTPTPTTKSSAKDITKFSFAALSPAVDATIDVTAKTITASVPTTTDISKLVPTITISDKATISPATGVVQDFSKAVSYTVTAEDGTTQAYVVTVIMPPSVTTSSATTILTSSAKIDGKITQTGSMAVIQYGHVWSSSNTTPTTNDSKTSLTQAGNYPLNYTSELTSLQANTTYNVRAYATSTVGTAYSNVITFKTSDGSNDFNSIKGIVLTGKTGKSYTDLDQTILLNLASGKVFKFSDGAANSAEIDLILSLYSDKDKIGSGSEDIIFFSPAGLLQHNLYWGSFPTVLSNQNWTFYKGTKLDYLSKTNYPPTTWWDKINTVTDLNTIINKEYISLSGSELTMVDSKGNLNDDRIYVFKNKEGKIGLFRLTNANKKVDTYTVTIDIKVQK